MAWQDPHTKTWTLPNREWHQSSKNEWDTWDCSVCASSNWLHHGAQKKMRRTCGVKRSYRDVAAAAAPSVLGTTQNSVKRMLQNVSEQLLSVSKPCNPNPPVDAAPTAVGGIVSMTPAEERPFPTKSPDWKRRQLLSHSTRNTTTCAHRYGARLRRK